MKKFQILVNNDNPISETAFCFIAKRVQTVLLTTHVIFSYQYHPQKESWETSHFTLALGKQKSLCLKNTDIHFSRGTPKDIHMVLPWKEVLSILLTEFHIMQAVDSSLL